MQKPPKTKLLLKVSRPLSKEAAVLGQATSAKAVMQFAKINLVGWLAEYVKPLQFVSVELADKKAESGNELLVTMSNPERKCSQHSFKCRVSVGSTDTTPSTYYLQGISVSLPGFVDASSHQDTGNAVKVYNGRFDNKALGSLFKTAYVRARDVSRSEHNRVKTVIAGRQKAFELNSKFRALVDAAGATSAPRVVVRSHVPIISASAGLKWALLSPDFLSKFSNLSDDEKLGLHVALVAAGYGDLLKPPPDKDTEYDEVMDEGLPLYAAFEKYYPDKIKERQEAIANRFAKRK